MGVEMYRIFISYSYSAE